MSIDSAYTIGAIASKNAKFFSPVIFLKYDESFSDDNGPDATITISSLKIDKSETSSSSLVMQSQNI